ncbi:MAG TPA: hypothetical protein VMW25_04715, partial [Clostridia bacterium]|nr:hypothetical protein [Clostridia bacterium]
MGWWGDMWKSIGNFLISTATFVIDGAVWLINTTKKAYLTAKHVFGSWISGMLDTAIGSLVALLVIVGFAIGAIFFGEALANSGFVLALKAARDKVKTAIQMVSESIKLKFFLDTHKVLASVWDDYRDIFKDLNNAFAGLAGELGYDAGTLLLMVNLGKSTAINSLQFVGIDSKTAEIEAMVKTQDFLERVD